MAAKLARYGEINTCCLLTLFFLAFLFSSYIPPFYITALLTSSPSTSSLDCSGAVTWPVSGVSCYSQKI